MKSLRSKRPQSFTLIELLVVISIIALLAGFAMPAIAKALETAKMATTMNNGKQVWMAANQSYLDGTTSGDTNLGWPADTGVASVNDYVKMLVDNGYLKVPDLKIFAISGKAVGSVEEATADKIAFRIGQISDTNEANTVFLISKNHPGTPSKELSGLPHKDAGFIVVRKAGDAGTYNKNQGDLTNLFGILPETWLQ